MTDQSDGSASMQRGVGFRSRFFTGTPASGRPTLPFRRRTSPLPRAGDAPAVPLSGNAPPVPDTSQAEEMPFAGRPWPPGGRFADEPTDRLPVVTATTPARPDAGEPVGGRPPERGVGRVVLIYEQHLRRPWRLVVFAVSIVSLTVGVVLGQTEAYQAPTSRTAQAAPQQPSEVIAAAPVPLTAPLGTVRQRRLEITGVATTLRVRTADLGESLYTVTMLGQAASPQLTDVGNTLVLALPAGETGTVNAEAVLSSKVDWTLKLTGEVTELDLDATAGGLRNTAIAAGVSRGGLRLPKPEGTVPLTVTGPIGELTVRTEAGAPVRVRVGKGAGLVTVNGTERRGVAAGTTLREAGWPAAANRYDLRVAAAVGTILVERLLPGS